MTLQETQQLLTILKMSYPNSYKTMTKEDAIDTVKLYQDFFGEYQTPIVVQALKNYIKKNQYPPTIAGLQEQIDLLLNKGDTNIELWNEIQKAASNCLYDLQAQYNKLSKPCQIWLRDANGLKDLAMLPMETLNTVTRGQFLKSIREIHDRETVQDAIPQNVKDMISGGFKQLT